MKYSEERQLRVKLARHILNLQTLKHELRRYDVAQLQKSAAVGAGRGKRLKVAAIVRQHVLEKQAMLATMAKLITGIQRRAAWCR